MPDRINYQIGFKIDNSGLKQAQMELQKIQQMSFKDVQLINPKIDQNSFNEIKKEASVIQNALTKAFNPKLNAVSINEFKKNLNGLDIKTMSQNFAQLGAAGQNAFTNITAELMKIQTPIKQTSKLLDSLKQTFLNTVKWSISSTVLNAFTGSIQKAWDYTKKLDSSLNDIRIVTEKSNEEMEKFAKNANKAAKNLGASTTNYTNASLIYYQQGLGEEDVQARTKTTIKAANVTGQSAAEVSEQLTAVWNGYKVVAEEAELYVDKLAAVAASTAADLEELSDGMSKVASAASTMGVDVDQLSAQLSTIISVTRQDASVVGTALKTIYARMGDLKVDGVDEFGTTLGDVSGQLQQMGINVLDQQGNLRDMGNVIEEVAAKWKTWTDAQQQAAAVAIAGKRQYNNLIALFENWDMYESALTTSQDSAGTLQKQQDIYMDSLKAHLKELSVAGEKLFDSIFNSDSMKKLIDVLAILVDKAAAFVDAIGGGGNLLLSLGGILTKVYGNNITNAISKALSNMKLMKTANLEEQAQKEIMQKFDETTIKNAKDIVELKKQELQYAKYLTEEEKRRINAGIDKVAQAGNELASTKEAVERARAELRTGAGYTVDPNKPVITRDKDGQYHDESGRFVSATQGNLHQDNDDIYIETVEGQINKLEDVDKYLDQLQSKSAKNNKKINDLLLTEGKNINLSDKNKINLNAIENREKTLDKELSGGATEKRTEEINKEKAALSSMKNLLEERFGIEKSIYETNQKLADENSGLSEGQRAQLATSEAIHKTEEERQAEMKRSRGFIKEQIELNKTNINTVKNGQEEINKKEKEYNEAKEQAGEPLKKEELKTKKLIDGFNLLTSSIMTTVSATQTLVNIFAILNDESLSTTEKVEQISMAVIAAVAMLVPAILSGISAIRTAGVGAGAKIQAAFGWISVVLMGIIAITGIVMGLIKNWPKQETALEKAEKAFDKANKAAENAKKKVTELKNEFSELQSTIENLRTARNAIDEMRVGTEEWKDAVAELNSKVLDLTEKYPVLLNYLSMDKNGIYEIDREGWDVVLKSQQNQIAKARTAVASAELNKTLRERDVLFAKKLPYDMFEQGPFSSANKYYDSYLDEANKILEEDNGKLSKEQKEAISKQATQIALIRAQTKVELGLTDASKAIAKELRTIEEKLEQNSRLIAQQTEAYLKTLAEEDNIADPEVYADIMQNALGNEEFDLEKYRAKYYLKDNNNDEHAYYVGLSGENINNQVNTRNDRQVLIDAVSQLAADLEYEVVGGLTHQEIKDQKLKFSEIENLEIEIRNPDTGEEDTITYGELITEAAERDRKEEIKKMGLPVANYLEAAVQNGISTASAYFALDTKIGNIDPTAVELNDYSEATLSELQLLKDQNVSGQVMTFIDDEGKTHTVIASKDYAQRLQAFTEKFEAARLDALEGAGFGNYADRAGFANFTIDDYLDFERTMNSANIAGAGSAIERIFEQYINSPEALSFINDKLKNVNFADMASVQAFVQAMHDNGYIIDESNTAWDLFIEKLLDGAKQWINNSEAVIKNLATIKELTKDLSIGEIISDEDYKRLISLGIGIEEYFIKTVDGYKSLVSGSTLATLLKEPFETLKDLKKYYDDLEVAAKASGVNYNSSLNAAGMTSEELTSWAQKFNSEVYNALLEYAGTDLSSFNSLISAADLGNENAISELQNYVTSINQILGDVESGYLNSQLAEEIWVTTYARNHRDVEKAYEEGSIGEAIYTKGLQYFRADYLKELGFTEAFFGGDSLDQLEEKVIAFRKLELDYLSKYEESIDKLNTQAEKLLGSDKINALNEIASIQKSLIEELNASNLNTRSLWEQTSTSFINSYLASFGEDVSGFDDNSDGSLSVLELYDLLATTEKGSPQYEVIESAIKIGERAEEIAMQAANAAYELIDLQIQIFEAGYDNAKQWYKIEKDRLELLNKFRDYQNGDLSVYGEQSAADIIANSFENYSTMAEEFSAVAISKVGDLSNFLTSDEIRKEFEAEVRKGWEDEDIYQNDEIFSVKDPNSVRPTPGGGNVGRVKYRQQTFSEFENDYITAKAAYDAAKKAIDEEEKNRDDYNLILNARRDKASELRDEITSAQLAGYGSDLFNQWLNENREYIEPEKDYSQGAAIGGAITGSAWGAALGAWIDKSITTKNERGTWQEKEGAISWEEYKANYIQTRQDELDSLDTTTEYDETILRQLEDEFNKAEQNLKLAEYYYLEAKTQQEANAEQRKTDRVNAINRIQDAVAAEENPFMAADSNGNIIYDDVALSDSVANAISEAQDLLMSMQEELQEAYDGYIKAQEELLALYDDEIKKLKNINSLYQGMADLSKIINSNAATYYENMRSGAEKQYELALAQYEQVEIEYKQLFDNEGNLVDGISDEMVDKIEESLQKAGENLIEITKERFVAIAEEMKYTIENELTQALGTSLENMSERWELEKANSEGYLDEVNARYGIDQLNREIQKSIDETDNISAQRRLVEMRIKQEERLNSILEERGELSQYELDRANAEYELTLRQIALEEAQQTANKLKLARDAMGNYTYQYVADQDAIADAEAALAEAENNLYNLDTERVDTLVGKYYSTWTEAQERIYEAAKEGDQAQVEYLEELYFGADGVLAKITSELGISANFLKTIGGQLTDGNFENKYTEIADKLSNIKLFDDEQVNAAIDGAKTYMSAVVSEAGALLGSEGALGTIANIVSGSVQNAISLSGQAAKLHAATKLVIDKLPDLTSEISILASQLDIYAVKYEAWLKERNPQSIETAIANANESLKGLSEAIETVRTTEWTLTVKDEDGDSAPGTVSTLDQAAEK